MMEFLILSTSPFPNRGYFVAAMASVKSEENETSMQQSKDVATVCHHDIAMKHRDNCFMKNNHRPKQFQLNKVKLSRYLSPALLFPRLIRRERLTIFNALALFHSVMPCLVPVLWAEFFFRFDSGIFSNYFSSFVECLGLYV